VTYGPNNVLLANNLSSVSISISSWSQTMASVTMASGRPTCFGRQLAHSGQDV